MATLEQKAAELAGRIAPDPALPPAEQLAASLDVFLGWVEEQGDAYAKLVRSAGAVPEVREVMEEVRAATAELILAGLAGPPSPARRAAVRAWLWFMDGAILDWLEHGDLTRGSSTRCCCGRSRAPSASRSSLRASAQPPPAPRRRRHPAARVARPAPARARQRRVAASAPRRRWSRCPTRSTSRPARRFLTGLLGAVELMPLVAMALLGGALADRRDRRQLLLLDQIALVADRGARSRR